MDPTEIRRLYIKGWFFIDLIATFPFDVFFDLILLGSTEVRSALESIEWRKRAPMVTIYFRQKIQISQTWNILDILKLEEC